MKGSADFDQLGSILTEFLTSRPDAGAPSEARRVAEAWLRVVGADAAANSQPRSMRGGKLVVATSSAGWAQALQEKEAEVVARLAVEVGEGVVRTAVFRPAGWDPCAGADSPRPLEADPGSWDRDAHAPAGSRTGSGGRGETPIRELNAEEQAAVNEVRRAAPDELLGERMSAAMKASLERGGAGGVG